MAPPASFTFSVRLTKLFSANRYSPAATERAIASRPSVSTGLRLAAISRISAVPFCSP